jgi:LmbE family N-acetylglucosaminyl deacetylase
MRYLVVEAHPDDMVFFCGGTVARLIRSGHEVFVLTVTDGQQGTLNRKYDSEEKLAATMRREHEAACSHLGVREVTYLGRKNHFLQNTHELREEIVREVRRVQPAAVFTLDPWNYDENPDHRAVGLATLEGCSFAHMHLFHPEHLEEGLTTAMVAKVILYKTDRPNDHTDISDTLEEKIRAALCYESQVELMGEEGRKRLDVLGLSGAAFEGDVGAMVELALRGVAREAGKSAGLEAAEAFHVRGLGILENIKELVGGLSVE